MRVPASFCGVYGMRPTHGRIPLEGALPFAPSYDTVGWFAANAAMLARVGCVLLGGAEGTSVQPTATTMVVPSRADNETRIIRKHLMTSWRERAPRLFQPSRTWSLNFQVAQPIFDFGARRAVRRQREADLQSSLFSLERVQIQARSEVRIARAAVEAQERALARAREAARHATEVLKITIIAFDAGSTTNIEVIDAQRSARDLDTAVAQAEDAVRQARLELLVALGRFPK